MTNIYSSVISRNGYFLELGVRVRHQKVYNTTILTELFVPKGVDHTVEDLMTFVDWDDLLQGPFTRLIEVLSESEEGITYRYTKSLLGGSYD